MGPIGHPGLITAHHRRAHGAGQCSPTKVDIGHERRYDEFLDLGAMLGVTGHLKIVFYTTSAGSRRTFAGFEGTFGDHFPQLGQLLPGKNVRDDLRHSTMAPRCRRQTHCGASRPGRCLLAYRLDDSVTKVQSDKLLRRHANFQPGIQRELRLLRSGGELLLGCGLRPDHRPWPFTAK